MDEQLVYDVVIVGAGPAGATAAYFLAAGGKRVALLEKATFPRDKRCGDAWCEPAIEILEEMGVIQELDSEGLVQWVRAGGLVSPSGLSFTSPDEGARASMPRVAAIRRIVCDERIARAADRVGADLIENASVTDVSLGDSVWTVDCKDGRRFSGRCLIAADGAKSKIARSLGVVTAGANSVASRQYIKGGTHNFTSDGVLLYPPYVLPGYVALFRHTNDDIDLGCYVLPGGRVPLTELKSVLSTEVANDPFVREVLGDHAEPLERPALAPLRLGGEPRSHGERFILLGDAAGQTDPLTGEGIHTAMIAAKIAARVLHEAFDEGDLSARRLASYHKAWMKEFGRDFPISAAAGRAINRFPALLDTAAVAAQRHGASFMDNFGAAMTGVKPKSLFLSPRMAVPLGAALLRFLRSRRGAIYAAGPRAEPAHDYSFARNALRGGSGA
ncbi:MAG: geranylgeranyl reductase family protein [Deltaproteobacteria bacterium]|nr:geranylgeranyl reductase family protein [Deltaproteobacteria bacterium]MBW2160961.1 geranylgeranyl reductase family protein [Deltaproteobacteria bacterium]MBW2377193.1 geranylgeranyl reductase family protein [Deltaproteobacteria bacterium]MBW2586166.1 geranylgeranyl reductase family protein [Deltaproteobacteria bacterium]